MDLDFNLLKRGLTVIILFAIIGFIIYKMTWKNNNILTAGSSYLSDVNSLEYNSGLGYNNNINNFHQDEKILNEIQEHISKQSDFDVSETNTSGIQNQQFERKQSALALHL